MSDSLSNAIPFSRPSIGPEEIDEVRDALMSGWLTTGPRTKRFEAEFAAQVNAMHALAVNSCTAGLNLALRCLDLKPGDEVITTPLTFCATVNSILEAGGQPVLADVGASLNIDPERIQAAVTPRTKAIIPVHYGGLPCEMDRIWELAEKHNLAVVEDAAHSVGAVYKGFPIGSGPSTAVAFSFYATKNLCTGEGGMITTSSDALMSRMRRLCLHGISNDAWNRYGAAGKWFYEVTEQGFKYNMSDVTAAIGIHQLRKLHEMNARRAVIAARYNEAFCDLPEVELPPDTVDVRHAWHLYVLRFNLDSLLINRDEIFNEMRRRGIGCSVHFIPIPLHPFYHANVHMPDRCRRALHEYPRLMSLPIYPAMSDYDVDRVIHAVRDIVRRNRASVSVCA